MTNYQPLFVGAQFTRKEPEVVDLDDYTRMVRFECHDKSHGSWSLDVEFFRSSDRWAIDGMFLGSGPDNPIYKSLDDRFRLSSCDTGVAAFFDLMRQAENYLGNLLNFKTVNA